ncbi:endonuclease III [Thiohalobacter sp. COW1]|uniref:endonuclease III domain-containing protein n=1 Tax=Thiohalobacter sp. COW1 TaxID=2795687 RepID=UPI001914E069|nr:endonuclease [Thiohalobacter sp. COW1]BCO30338.1 endonuclease III [Thiohalobacter sp. COW1]
MSLRLSKRVLLRTFDHLYAQHGPQHWWPGETPFEVMVGAILTQNTAWTNVERAIANLRQADCLTPDCLLATDFDQVADWLRPSGYFNIKTRRLREFCDWYLDQGGYARLRRRRTHTLRTALLGVRGIGPETADDILLYAFNRPVFVIDAYTRRLFTRLGLIAGDEPYDSLRLAVEAALPGDVQLFNEYHALIVNHAKDYCRPKPRCEACRLRRGCGGVPEVSRRMGGAQRNPSRRGK